MSRPVSLALSDLRGLLRVIESFRNKLWPGYKTSTGVPRDLLAQFHLIEELLSAARRQLKCLSPRIMYIIQ